MELQVIQSKIYEIRGCRVMLDFELAKSIPIINLNLEQHGATAFKMIERVGEGTMKAINNFSEYYRKELDGIFLALFQWTDKQNVLNKPRNPIGFHTYDIKTE